MVRMGFDLSINSTGVCVDTGNKIYYYIVTSHDTKSYITTRDKLAKDKSPLQIDIYEKGDIKGLEYSAREAVKTDNLFKICASLEKIVNAYKPDLVQIEGVAYGATTGSSIIDLSGLNFMVRMMLENHKIPYRIVSPTENKKFATGNGLAKKDLMIYSWQLVEPKMKELTSTFPKSVTIDDIADAYFLCKYEVCQP